MQTIQTHRMTLRRLELSDVDNLFLLESDPDVMKFTPAKIPQTHAQTLVRLAEQIAKQAEREPFGIWGAFLKNDNVFVGWFMLMPLEDKSLELGFMLVKDKWNKGYATEANLALVDYAKNKKTKQLVARTNLENLASIHILEKLGFKFKKMITAIHRISGREEELRFFEMPL